MGIENSEGILVQEMVAGNRELVLGMVRDPQFNVAIMLGLGGVMTEIFEDITFRAAPFSQREALDMVEQLDCAKMLGSFRGQEPVALKSLTNALTSLGELGLSRPDIKEIDINPLKIDPRGNLTAVDALVVLEEELHA
jgi:succinyl-CoA synthetase beta subunit